MKKDKFSIKFKQKIVNGTANVFFNESPVRIICWDRDCEYPIVGLMKSNSNLPETIVIIKNDGTMAVPGMGLVHKDGLYVHHAELPSRVYRVKYCILRLNCPEHLWDKYGYVEDEEESFHDNAVRFVNDIAPKFLIELHDDLKKNGNWLYDDDEDWNFDFNAGERVVCISNNAPWYLEVGKMYTFLSIDTVACTVLVKDDNGNKVVIPFFDCIDLFDHIGNTTSGKYDFTKMKPFTPVLVRNEDNNTWFPHFFESYHPQNVAPFRVMGTLRDFLQCVPFEGNEHLLKTQDPIPPFYDLRK